MNTQNISFYAFAVSYCALIFGLFAAGLVMLAHIVYDLIFLPY